MTLAITTGYVIVKGYCQLRCLLLITLKTPSLYLKPEYQKASFPLSLAVLMLQVGLLALKVGHGALRALHSTTAALDLYEQVISPVTSKQEGVRPPPPDTPQLLPSVHVLWGALVGALKVSLCLRSSPHSYT